MPKTLHPAFEPVMISRYDEEESHKAEEDGVAGVEPRKMVRDDGRDDPDEKNGQTPARELIADQLGVFQPLLGKGQEAVEVSFS